MYEYSFEKLQVWQKAKALAKDVYGITKSFPNSEQFNLTAQMQRAAISIVSNLAEGTSRSSYKDKARFSEMSYGSLMELLAQLIISYELGYVKEESYLTVRSKVEDLGKSITNLKNQQLSMVKEDDPPYFTNP
ncbi:MAG TPA: four helix bundle protein [Saprospiraceae bacterium]|nr:four helix bundle protein [Saprospiraceae bacterium]HPI05552.1 four helix bundle protein [Saprospiraceae bacterium]